MPFIGCNSVAVRSENNIHYVRHPCSVLLLQWQRRSKYSFRVYREFMNKSWTKRLNLSLRSAVSSTSILLMGWKQPVAILWITHVTMQTNGQRAPASHHSTGNNIRFLFRHSTLCAGERESEQLSAGRESYYSKCGIMLLFRLLFFRTSVRGLWPRPRDLLLSITALIWSWLTDDWVTLNPC